MGIFGKKRYIKCQKEEDNSISCLSYQPTKDGKKIPVASIRGTVDPSCSLNLMDQDGDPVEIEKLEEHLSKRAKVKCNKNTPSEI